MDALHCRAYSRSVDIEQELCKPPVELYRVKLRGLKSDSPSISLDDTFAWTFREEIGSLGVCGVTQMPLLIGSVEFPSSGLNAYKFRLVVDHRLLVIDEDLSVGKVRLPKWVLVKPGHVVSLSIEWDAFPGTNPAAFAAAQLEVAIYGFEVSESILSKLSAFVERAD